MKQYTKVWCKLRTNKSSVNAADSRKYSSRSTRTYTGIQLYLIEIIRILQLFSTNLKIKLLRNELPNYILIKKYNKFKPKCLIKYIVGLIILVKSHKIYKLYEEKITAFEYNTDIVHNILSYADSVERQYR